MYDFRFYFTPLPRFFSPFPHGTGSLSVTNEYLALEGGPPRFRPGFTCPALLGILDMYANDFKYGAITLYGQLFQVVLLSLYSQYCWSRNPSQHADWFWLIRVRSPLLTESRLISFPMGTEMFHFPTFAYLSYLFT